jgi:hypothetical protein
MKKTSLSIIIIVIFSLSLFPQTSEYYFRFKIKDLFELDELTNIISIDKLENEYVYAYANQGVWQEMEENKFDLEILPPPSSLYEHKMTEMFENIKGWDSYPTYLLYLTMMKQYADSFPQICRLDTFGYSSQGRMLLVMKITDNPGMEENEPEFFYTSTMHGDETAGFVLMLRLIDYLLHQCGDNSPEGQRVTQLVNNVEIWINPFSNPDGTYAGGNHTVNGATRFNANGKDLNRNFPDRISDPNNSPFGREPETQAMMYLVSENNFNLSANFHGGAQVVNYPWDNGASSGTYSACPDDSWFIDMCLNYAFTNPDLLAGGFPNGITNGCHWYVIFGGRQDWIYYWHGGRETTIELFDIKNPPGSMLPQRWDNNKESFLSYIKQTFTGIRGVVLDSATNESLWVQIDVMGYPEVPVFSDPNIGDFHRLLLPGIYDLIVRSPHYKTDTLFGISVLDTGATELEFLLQKLPQNSISGIVHLSNTNYSAGITVMIENRTVHTNESGFFEFRNVYAGPVCIEISKEGYSKSSVDTAFDALNPLWIEVIMNPSINKVLVIDDDRGDRQGIAIKDRAGNKETVASERIFNYGQSANLIENSLTGAGYEVYVESSLITNPEDWTDYNLLFWSSGAETSPISSPDLQNALISFAQDTNKALVIEGGGIGYDFQNNFTFKSSVLHFDSWITDDAGDLTVEDTNQAITSGLPPNIFLNFTGWGDQDAVSPSLGTIFLISNIDQPGSAGGILFDNNVFFAFNLASLNMADAIKLVRNTADHFLPARVSQYDIAVIKVLGISPGEMVTAGQKIQPIIEFRNDGSQSVANIPVELRILEENQNILFSQEGISLDSLRPGQSALLNAGAWYVPDTTSNLIITASVILLSDEIQGNNFLTFPFNTVSVTTIVKDDFEAGVDSLGWIIVNSAGDTSDATWHYSFLPALGKYSMKVNPGEGNSYRNAWLISPELVNPSQLNFYWDYGADFRSDTLIILTSTSENHPDSFVDTLLSITKIYRDSVNHFDHLLILKLDATVRFIAFVYKGQNGHYWAIDNVSVNSNPTIVNETYSNQPKSFSLFPNFPNPFNSTTTIRFDIPVTTKAKVYIFNVLGQEISELVNTEYAPGIYKVRWDGKNQEGKDVSSGIYFYRFESSRFSQTQKMLLIC